MISCLCLAPFRYRYRVGLLGLLAGIILVGYGSYFPGLLVHYIFRRTDDELLLSHPHSFFIYTCVMDQVG